MNETPYEEDEQITLVDWLDLTGLKFTAIPNSTWTTSNKQKAKNKKMGLRRGFLDIIIFSPEGTLCIEMKRTKGGVVSEDQKAWIDVINATPMAQAAVCYGVDEAIATVRRVLKI